MSTNAQSYLHEMDKVRNIEDSDGNIDIVKLHSFISRTDIHEIITGKDGTKYLKDCSGISVDYSKYESIDIDDYHLYYNPQIVKEMNDLKHGYIKWCELPYYIQKYYSSDEVCPLSFENIKWFNQEPLSSQASQFGGNCSLSSTESIQKYLSMCYYKARIRSQKRSKYIKLHDLFNIFDIDFDMPYKDFMKLMNIYVDVEDVDKISYRVIATSMNYKQLLKVHGFWPCDPKDTPIAPRQCKTARDYMNYRYWLTYCNHNHDAVYHPQFEFKGRIKKIGKYSAVTKIFDRSTKKTYSLCATKNSSGTMAMDAVDIEGNEYKHEFPKILVNHMSAFISNPIKSRIMYGYNHYPTTIIRTQPNFHNLGA